MEGKELPDYSGTDPYQVCLTFKAPILDKAFVIFIRKVQDNRPAAEQLNVFELLALYKIAKMALIVCPRNIGMSLLRD